MIGNYDKMKSHSTLQNNTLNNIHYRNINVKSHVHKKHKFMCNIKIKSYTCTTSIHCFSSLRWQGIKPSIPTLVTRAQPTIPLGESYGSINLAN